MTHCVPIRLWGDDAPVGKNGLAARCMSWSYAVVRLEAMWSKLGIYVMDPRYMLPETEPMVHKVLAWSMNVLAGGVWPLLDHRGQAWPPNSEHAP